MYFYIYIFVVVVVVSQKVFLQTVLLNMNNLQADKVDLSR